MALDRQKILNELGSVMNQLQSADCGCMNKLFSNPSGGQEGAVMSNPQPSGGCGGFGGFGGHRGGCCHGHGGFKCSHGGGFNAQGAGEPSCGGFIGNNPKKLYADTYNYLNQNLMQPVVKDVYNDLKTITPENTIMGNNMASELGFSPQGGQIPAGNIMQGGNSVQEGGNSMPMGYGMQGGNVMQEEIPAIRGGNAMQVGYAMQGGNPMQGGNSVEGRNPTLGGYSMGGYAMQGRNTGMQQNQITGSGMGGNIQGANQGNAYMLENEIPGSIGFQMHDTMKGDTRLAQNQMQGLGYQTDTPMNNNQIRNQNTQQMMSGMGPNIVKLMQIEGKTKPQTGQMTTGRINQEYNADAGISNNPNQQMFSPTTQYTTNSNTINGFNHNAMTTNMRQGQANSSAVQMGNSDPATQQMASAKRNYGPHTQGIKKFNEMFPGLMNGDLGFDPMAMAIDINPENRQKSAMNSIQKMMCGSKEYNKTNAINGLNADPAQNVQRNTIPIHQQNVLLSNQQTVHGQPGSVVTPMTPNQQYEETQQRQQYQYQQQQMINPHTEALKEQTLSQANREPTQLPADTTIEQTSEPRTNYQYNTLGQPVRLLPAQMYQNLPEKNLPQTLSAEPPSGKLRNDIARFNVKSTVSKTALITNKPLGKAPSRNQLQNIYNQYKSSQSYTQQNIGKPSKRETTSEGRLGLQWKDEDAVRAMPIERVGGDTIANNEAIASDTPVKEQAKQQHTGDVPVGNEQHGDFKSTKGSNGNYRNGLQDMTYTHYPASAAWTFHGESNRPPFTNYVAQRAQMIGSTTISGTKTAMSRVTNPRKRS